MTSSSTGSSNSPRDGTTESQPREETVPTEITPFLESVLSETTSLNDAVETLSPQALSALLQVAEKYRGESLSLQPIGKQLVLAMLNLNMQPQWQSPTVLDSMASEIAITLFDDPWARGRLLGLWTRLTEALP